MRWQNRPWDDTLSALQSASARSQAAERKSETRRERTIHEDGGCESEGGDLDVGGLGETFGCDELGHTFVPRYAATKDCGTVTGERDASTWLTSAIGRAYTELFAKARVARGDWNEPFCFSRRGRTGGAETPELPTRWVLGDVVRDWSDLKRGFHVFLLDSSTREMSELSQALFDKLQLQWTPKSQEVAFAGSCGTDRP